MASGKGGRASTFLLFLSFPPFLYSCIPLFLCSLIIYSLVHLFLYSSRRPPGSETNARVCFSRPLCLLYTLLSALDSLPNLKASRLSHPDTPSATSSPPPASPLLSPAYPLPPYLHLTSPPLPSFLPIYLSIALCSLRNPLDLGLQPGVPRLRPPTGKLLRGDRECLHDFMRRVVRSPKVAFKAPPKESKDPRL